MSWLKLDDRWAEHPKFTDPETGALCQLLHARSLCYAGRYLTDGFLPASVIPTFLVGFDALGLLNGAHGRDALEVDWPVEMVKAGLWDAVENGWRIHDYLMYNPSKNKVETARKLQQRGGKHSQEIQRSRSYPQGSHQASLEARPQLSPVPVPEKKEKDPENPRSRKVPVEPVDKKDRTTKGFEPLAASVRRLAGLPPEEIS